MSSDRLRQGRAGPAPCDGRRRAARRLVQKLKAHQNSGEFAQMIALKDEATQLSAALAHITEPWHPELACVNFP